MNEAEYLNSLPRKRMGAGCLFFDKIGRVMLVKPTYKPVWEIPGGVVERNESPKECCQREVQEEIGLARAIGALLVVDYNRPTAEKTESLMFIFDGGVLTETEIESIHLDQKELQGFEFFQREALPKEMTRTLKKRVLAAWRQVNLDAGIYLEDQDG